MAPGGTRTHASCPLCGGSLTTRYDDVPDRLGTSPGGYRVDECAGCGLGLINPAPTGDLSPYYPENYLSQEGEGSTATSVLTRVERAYREDQYRYDFALLRRSTGVDIGTVDSYVDIGCGSGERVAFVHARGCRRSVGVDRYRFDKSGARAGVEFVNTEIDEFRPSARFSVVSLFHVLEHVEDPVGVLRHLREAVVTEEGALIVQVPNYGSLERKVFGRRWFGLDAPRHLFQFDTSTVRRALEDAGFDVVGVHRTNAPWHPVTLVPSLFPALDVQRIWVRPGSVRRKLLAQVLWAAVTVAVLPVAWLQNLAGNASMLTVVARPRPVSG